MRYLSSQLPLDHDALNGHTLWFASAFLYAATTSKSLDLLAAFDLACDEGPAVAIFGGCGGTTDMIIIYARYRDVMGSTE